MKDIYMRLVILVDHSPYEWWECTLYQIVDGGELEVSKPDMATALRMMWELKLAGAEKTVKVHPYNTHIVTREITFYTRH